MDRREVIQRVLMGTTALIMVPAFISSCEKGTEPEPISPSTGKDLIIDLSLPSNSSLNTAGGSVIVEGIIIANTGNNKFVAVASACTHEGSTVGYKYSTNNFQCPSHNSIFSATGSVIKGPAATALKSYTVNLSGNILTIKR
jgi:cytochrome b6-f complex iron-sulfur subunit